MEKYINDKRYKRMCALGACTKVAEYMCPSCKQIVCSEHAASQICSWCYENWLADQEARVEDVED